MKILPNPNILPINPCLILNEVICLNVADLKFSEIIPCLIATRLLVIMYLVELFFNTITAIIIRGIKIVHIVTTAKINHQK